MPAWKAELYDIDSVMEYYSSAPETGFIVYAGNRPDPAYARYEHYGDKTIGEGILHDALKALEQARLNTNVYLLEVFAPESARTTAKKKITKGKRITFQLNGITAHYPGSPMDRMMQMAGMQLPGASKLEEKLDKLIELQTARAAIGAAAEGDDQPATLMEVLAGFLERDEVQVGVVNLISGMAEKIGLVPEGTMKATASASMGEMGSDQDPLLSQAIDILKRKDPQLGKDLLILAELSEQDPDQFKMLIGALRAQRK